MQQPLILVVDDDPEMYPLVAQYLQQAGMSTIEAASGPQALDLARLHEFDAAIVDLNLPGLAGIELTRILKVRHPDLEIIIFTGYPTLESSIQALREAAFDYLQKPLGIREIARVTAKAVEHRRLVRQNRELLRQLEIERNSLKKQVQSAQRALEQRISSAPEFIGESRAIKQVRHMIAEVAPTDMTVLIRGESGTGKDVVARLIHRHSGCRSDTFVKINCPAIPEPLLESELFGHERGAFTGSERKKPGRFELAQNGTIFLDEIGEIPAGMQVKLLQAIEHKQFTRLGGDKTITIHGRIIAATNATLEHLIQRGDFRADLYYRLNEYSIMIPPLRERSEDVPQLVRHFLELYCLKFNRALLKPSAETLALLRRHPWPGNVRELEALMRRYALSGSETVIARLLEQSAPAPEIVTPPPEPPRAFPPHALNFHFNSSNRLDESEIQIIMNALAETRWNQRQAAQNLGISYSTLRRRIAKYNLREAGQ